MGRGIVASQEIPYLDTEVSMIGALQTVAPPTNLWPFLSHKMDIRSKLAVRLPVLFLY